MVLILAWIGIGVVMSTWLLEQVDILWVVGMRRRLWKPLMVAGTVTAAMAAYVIGTGTVLWTLYAVAVHAASLATPMWVWMASVVGGGAVAGAIINTARLNMKTWVRMESRGA